jgi:hypothetical protein
LVWILLIFKSIQQVLFNLLALLFNIFVFWKS